MMHIFSHPEFDNHQQVVFFKREKSGLRGIIAIHKPFFHPILKRPSTLGGTRMQPYKTTDDAYTDDLRLSKGMTYKSALVGVDFGGAKAVIIGDPMKDKTPELLDDFADVLNNLQGLYVVGEDMGMTEEDMNYLSGKTPWVSGKSKSMGGSGNPGSVTALGVFKSIETSLEFLFGTRDPNGHSFAIAGLGNVGHPLAVLIAQSGGTLLLADTNEEKISQAVQKIQAYTNSYQVEKPDTIHKAEVTVYCPCAGGAIVNDATIDEFQCHAIVGSANNQLERREHGDALHKRNILYAPDYVANAGGLINVTGEFEPGGYNEAVVQERVNKIPERLKLIFLESRRRGVSPHRVADEMAEKIIAQKVAECDKKMKERHVEDLA